MSRRTRRIPTSRWMLPLLFLFLPVMAAAKETDPTIPEVDPAAVEIFNLGADHYAFFWPAPEPITEPFQSEADWNGRRWTLTPGTARPSQEVWQEIIEDLPNPEASRLPDRRVVALYQPEGDQETLRLTFFLPGDLASYEFVRPKLPAETGEGMERQAWLKRQQVAIDLQSLLGLPERDLVKTFTGGEREQGEDLWNAWLSHFLGLKRAQLVVYRASRRPEMGTATEINRPWVRTIQEMVDAPTWQRSFLATTVSSQAAKTVQPRGEAPSSPTAAKPSAPSWLWWLLGIEIVLAAALGAAYGYNEWQRRRRASVGPVNSILREILAALRRHALVHLRSEPRPSLGLEEKALEFGQDSYERAAQALFGRATLQLRHLNAELHSNLIRWLSSELGAAEAEPARLREAVALGLSVLDAHEESRRWWQLRRQRPAEFLESMEVLRKGLEEAERRTNELGIRLNEAKELAASQAHENEKLRNENKNLSDQLAVAVRTETDLHTKISTLESEKTALMVAKGELEKQRFSEALKSNRRAHLLEVLGFLDKARIHYWNYGQHSPSSTVLLFIQYLAAWQVTEGIERGEQILESVGWANLQSLLQRLATIPIPSLEAHAREFLEKTPEFQERRQFRERPADDRDGDFLREVLRHIKAGPPPRQRIDLEQLESWPLYFRAEGQEVWRV
jgi:hypothetical protein